MNDLILALQRLAAQRVLEPKWLLAPSLRVGHQWLETVVRNGQPAINFRALTMLGLALEIAGPVLATRQARLLTSSAGVLLLDSILDRVATRYLSQSERSPNLARAIFASIRALRLAGLDPGQLDASDFEVAEKGLDLQTLLDQYTSQLRAWKVVDEADVFSMAIDRLRQDSQALADDVVILIPDVVRPTGLALSLIENVPDDKRQRLPGEQAEEPPSSDRCLLRWLHEPLQAADPIRDGTVEVFRAVGAVNEVREVLRRCVGNGCSLDDVEVLHTNSEVYVPLFYELAHRLLPEDEIQPRIPVTFAEGIPALYGRPARALRAWLSWIEQDFAQQALVRMLHDGLVVVDCGKAEIGAASLTAMFRQMGIGWGRQRYLPQLDEQLSAAKQQLKSAKDVVNDEDEQAAAASSQERLQRRIAGLKALRKLVASLLQLSLDHQDAGKLLTSSLEFLQKISRCASEIDEHAREALIQEIQQMRQWRELAGDHDGLDLRNWLRELPAQVRILSSGPRPGCLHVAHVMSGGHSGRAQTLAIGLDDSRFPGSPMQDPLLLDGERQRISNRLVKSSDQLEESLRAFVRNVTRLAGKVTFGYPCWDPIDDRELFPSPVVLSVYRLISGNHDADQHDLDDALPAAVSFACDDPSRALEEGEWWLSQLCGDRPVKQAAQIVHQRFPHLARGRSARTARESNRLTPFDGYVPEAGGDFDPFTSDRVFSASALETVGQCPLKYFFHYALHVRPLQELIIDPERWLDALTFGSLLHSVFRQFMAELRERGRVPDLARDERRLAEILKTHIEECRKEIPPPNETAFRSQCRDLQLAARVFLDLEARFCQQSRPEYLEASIGLPAEGGGTALDQSQPVQIALPGGGSMNACGRIDRIDHVGAGASPEFSIWDYKTGSSWKYNKSDPFQQGRIVQQAVYLDIVAPILQRKVDPQAVVRLFGYFFPSVRTWGERMSWTPDELAEGRAIMGGLCQLIGSGAFLPTDNAEDCRFCDYDSVCCDLDASAAGSKGKIDNEDNPALIPMRNLRRNVTTTT